MKEISASGNIKTEDTGPLSYIRYLSADHGPQVYVKGRYLYRVMDTHNYIDGQWVPKY